MLMVLGIFLYYKQTATCSVEMVMGKDKSEKVFLLVLCPPNITTYKTTEVFGVRKLN